MTDGVEDETEEGAVALSREGDDGVVMSLLSSSPPRRMIDF